MTKRATMRINTFRRKSGVHSLLSPRQTIFGRNSKHHCVRCKMGELVVAYDVLSKNKTSKPKTFYALYIGPNDEGTSYSVFKLSTKKDHHNTKTKPIPMPDNVIEALHQMGEDDGSLDRIDFCNILKESIIDYMYGDVNSQDNSICASDRSWDMAKDGGQEDQKNIVLNDVVDDDKMNNLNEDGFHLRNSIEDNINDGNKEYNYVEQDGVINQQDGQVNHFDGANHYPQAQNEYLGRVNEHDQNNVVDDDDDDNNDDDNNNKGQNQGGNNNNHAEISDDGSSQYTFPWVS